MKKYEDVTEYQGQVAAQSTDFPFGAPIDSPTPGVGTPYTAATEKVHQALIQKLFAVAGVTPNGVSDTAVNSQLYDVMQLVLNDFNNTSNRNASLVAVGALAALGLGADDLQSTLEALQNGAVSTKQTSTTDSTTGRLLTTGAFGLGGNAVTVTNFNTVDKCGYYYGLAGATGAPDAVGAYFVWHLQTGTVGADSQVAISQDNGALYHRIKKGGAGTFEPWLPDGEPVATILESADPSAPEGYLPMDGAAVSRDTYAQLFAVIGTTYGTGDGSTTFNVPNDTSSTYNLYIKF